MLFFHFRKKKENYYKKIKIKKNVFKIERQRNWQADENGIT